MQQGSAVIKPCGPGAVAFATGAANRLRFQFLFRINALPGLGNVHSIGSDLIRLVHLGTAS